MNARHNANKRLGAGHPTVAIGVKSKRTTEENTRYQNKDLLILLLHNNSLFPIHFIQLVKSVQDCSTLVQNLWHGCPWMMLLIVVHAINPNYGCLFTVCIPWTARHAGKRLWLVPYAGTLDGDGDGVHLIVVNILVTHGWGVEVSPDCDDHVGENAAAACCLSTDLMVLIQFWAVQLYTKPSSLVWSGAVLPIHCLYFGAHSCCTHIWYLSTACHMFT